MSLKSFVFNVFFCFYWYLEPTVINSIDLRRSILHTRYMYSSRLYTHSVYVKIYLRCTAL